MKVVILTKGTRFDEQHKQPAGPPLGGYRKNGNPPKIAGSKTASSSELQAYGLIQDALYAHD